MLDFLRLDRLRKRAEEIRDDKRLTENEGELVGELIDLLDEALHEVVTDTTPKPDPTQQAFEAFDLYRRLGVMAS